MSKEIIDELKLIGQYFDVSNLDVYEQKHHIRFTSIIKDRIDFYINLTDVVRQSEQLCQHKYQDIRYGTSRCVICGEEEQSF
jgi:hypothetical protein